MTIQEEYSIAVAYCKEKKFDEALKILKELKKVLPDWREPQFLEIKIYGEQRNFVRENVALEELIPKFNLRNPQEKNQALEMLNHLATTDYRLAMPEKAVKNYRVAAQLAPDDVIAARALSGAIFAACYIEDFSAEDFRDLYAEYQKHMTVDKIFRPKIYYNHEKIRVGFLSNTFKRNVVMEWSWSLLNKLDRELFEVYFYARNNKADKVTNYLIETSDVWRDISKLNDAEAAELIHDDEIDILFDLTVHTKNNLLRIATYHPATVQISGIGYVSSTGLDCFDYFLSDIYCAGNPDYFTEKLLCLPHSHICYEPEQLSDPAAEPPCVANGFVTFGCFNRFGKITDSMLRAWKKILDAVPNSRLLLKTKIFGTEDGKNFVRNRLGRFGFDVSRVDMRGSSSDYLDHYRDIDIALDTFPYAGGITTCEALYMGVPVVSLYGERHGERIGLSILKNIGLDGLAVRSYGDYVKLAIAMANDWKLLSFLRKNLRTMMKKSPLMDSKTYIHDIEDAFVKILLDARKKKP